MATSRLNELQKLLSEARDCEAAVDAFYCNRDANTDAEFRQRALHSQTVLERLDVEFDELELPPSKADCRLVEEEYEREISLAAAEFSASKKTKVTRQTYQARVQSAEDRRTHQLGKTHKDNCNNWGNDKARFVRVLDHAIAHLPTESKHALVEDARLADACFEEAEEKRNTGNVSEAESKERQAVRCHQRFLGFGKSN